MEQLAHTPTTRCEGGFTLVELMVALVVLGVVLTGVVQMFRQTGRYHTGQEMMVTTSQDLRAAKMLMVQEIREAGLNPSIAAPAGIGFQTNGDDRFNTDANSLHMTRDQFQPDPAGSGNEVDGYDGKTDGTDEDISYYRTNDNCLGVVGAVLAAGVNTPGCLRRNTAGAGAGAPVMPNVTNLQFVYYDANNAIIPPATLTSLSKLEDIRTVEVTLTGQVENPGAVSEPTQTLQFRILARNM
ncbi:MAG: prepilin-type N-terminal cleavage/methylation domain-containing protein [Proteobacteria bacterium]|nr:prepilin-type N-terminal cleavage/methylation domain-containing protein [Pseudomonadota bacterium]MBU1648807.1 prepilin-type N-terminal cleavage/methylation domain-containing protein [Pseudomonadota bacterium]